MKFLYEYRTSDNVKHNGVIAASDREAAFAALKAQGIRPGFLAEAPGFFNKLFGKGKRWIVIGVLGLAVVVAAFVIHANNRIIEQTQDMFDSPVRRQLVGDTATIAKGIRTGWADVFTLEGDRFLASYAIPGVEPSVRSTTVEKINEALQCPPPPSTSASSLEARQILAIVAGMKREIAELRSAGWTLGEICASLVRRQERELAYYRQAENEVKTASRSDMSASELMALWEEKNDKLRRLGIRLVPLPE